jgi:hypothetical protein
VTAICIAGMHRSGTSLVARLLHLCDLYLGQESELMPPSPDNLDGYWEHLEFVDINNSLLAHFNGNWYQPPTKVSFEDLDKIPTSLIEKAQRLIQRLNDSRASWGWKDPRNSLTFSFWKQLIPDLKVVVSLRNPLEVAHSVVRRDNLPIMFSLELWQIYNQRLLSAVAPGERVITHYSTYFVNPQEELRRLLNFVGISPENNRIEKACLATLPDLKHHQATIESLIGVDAPLNVINLYVEMCSQAGPIYKNIAGTDVQSAHPDTEKQDDTETNLLRALSKNHMLQLLEKEQKIQALATQIAYQEHVANTTLAELNEIKNSRAWRFIQTYREVRSRLKL